MTDNDRRQFFKATLAGAVGVLAGASGCKKEGDITRAEVIERIAATVREEESELPQPSPPQEPPAEPPKSQTRKELLERLKKLAESEVPTNLSRGANCYATDYGNIPGKEACPDCGQTMAVGQMEAVLRSYNVPLIRLRDQGLDAELILPEHCPTCGFGMGNCGRKWEDWIEESNLRDWQTKIAESPEALFSEEWKEVSDIFNAKSESRKLQLEIKYPDHPVPVRVALNSASELEIMAIFLQGKDRYVEERDRETAMKDKIERLCELFGLVGQE